MNTSTTVIGYYRPAASQRAREVLAKHGKSFDFAGRLLGRKQFRDCARLYRFCRYLDDLADDAANSITAQEKLQRVIDELSDGQSNNPLVADFIALSHEHRLPFNPVHNLVRGLRSDLDDVRLETEAQLKRYCYQVAGTVGILMCGVLGVRDPRALPHAIDLGIAMQLTNIARDVREDALAGRRYIPADWLGPISPRSIISADGHTRKNLQASVQALLHEAERYYRSGEAGLAYLPWRARLAILVAARVYRAIGKELAERDYATWLGRATVSTPSKLLIAARAVGEFLSTLRLHRAPALHDADLHAYLSGLPGTGSHKAGF